MKVVAISDLHGRLPGERGLAPIPECDILLIAGDFCAEFTRMFDPDIMRMRQEQWLANEFVEWENKVPAKHIVITPGNHDWILKLPLVCRSRLLIDEEVEIEGLRIYGTPWVPPIMSWNYMLPREHRKVQFAQIPEGLDFLVSHCPAHKVLDKAYDGEECGCPELRQAVYRARPKYMVHGHIHEGQRWGNHAMLGVTSVYNVAIFREDNWVPVEIYV